MAATSTTASSKPAGQVLVVEDDPQMGRFLQAGLTRAEIGVAFVTTGEAALQRLAAEPFDLVVLDLRLPGISGFEVCHQLKADPRLRHLPVIFVSVHNDHQMRARAFALGAAEYFTKPLQMQGFIACITRLLTLVAARRSGLPHAALLPSG